MYSWTRGCIGAFEYFGGVTELLIPDNAKAAVTKPCRYEPGLNQTFLDMAQHYGTAVLPARVRHPKDKAKVEMAVGVVTRWILAGKRVKLTELSPEALNAFDQETLIAVVMRLYEQNKQLSGQLQSLVHEKYGRKTERFDDPDQLRLLPTGSSPIEQQSIEDGQAESMKSAERTKRPGHTRNPMPSHLNRQRLERQPRQDELICPCGEHRTKVNDVVRNSRYEYVPATLYIEDIVDAVWEYAPGVMTQLL